jgi:signal transduction histidine kinase
LRQVIFQRMAQKAPCPSKDFIRLNAGIDAAIGFSIRRYIENRDHVRDRFVAMLGHDLRNPLTAVLMTAEGLLRSESLIEDDREGMQDIVDAAQRMNRMVLDILDFARSQTTDCVPVSPAACDMADICRDAVAEVQHAHPAPPIGLTLAGDLLGAFDRDRVFQALVNVLANAAQHGSAPIHLAAWEADDRRALITRVSNAGAAIPQEKIAQLFKPYVHAASESGGSLRLGLHIVAQIARAHGATYDVSSNEQATTFTIRWPRSPYDETPDRP